MFVVNQNLHYRLFSMNKRVKRGFFYYFIDNHYNSTFKYHNFLALSSFGGLIIDEYQYAFDQVFEALEKNKP